MKETNSRWRLAAFKRKLIPVFFLSIVAVELLAQAASPYSRYGLGYVRSNVFSANAGMGGIAAAYGSAININAVNPASYATLTRTTIEMGVNYDGLSIKTKDSVYRANNGNLNHIVIGFVPKPDKWAITAGLLPYTNINYNFVQQVNDSALGPFSNVYAGKGSLYQAFVGGAYKIKSRINERDNFSIGLNLGYIFGKLEYQKIISFPDSVQAYSTRNNTLLNVNGFSYNAGVQYRRRIFHNTDNPDERTDIFMTLGAYGSGGVKLNGKLSNYWDRFEPITGSGLVSIDTQEATFNHKEKLTMPYTLGGGVLFGNERFWMIGADFSFTNWSVFSSPLANDKLHDSWRMAFGFQITPNYDDRKYFNRVQFRLGGYFGKNQFSYAGKALNEAGGTIGLGFPFKNVAHLNLTGNFGSRGVQDTNALRENFYQVIFGFVLNDIWFVKRKFD